MLTKPTQAGQICMSTERILVHSSIASAFESALKEAVNSLYGSVATTPVLVTETSARRNKALVDDAVGKGARKVDLFPESEETETGHEEIQTKMRPVALTNMAPSMDLYKGESFGPSVSLYAFDTEDEMVALANNTDYGLSASIFSDDLRAALRVAERLDSGAVHINSMTVHDEFALPHGGVKKSGYGRFNGYQGLEEFLYTKSITWNE